MRGVLGLLAVFSIGLGSVWTLGAGARSAVVPHLTMTSQQFAPSGTCAQQIQLAVHGNASSPELGSGTFDSAVQLVYAGSAVTYRESFTATVGSTVVRGTTSGTGTGTCSAGTASGTFATSLSSPAGAGTSAVDIQFPYYSHVFTPASAPATTSAATSTAATTTAATTTTAAATTTATTTTAPLPPATATTPATTTTGTTGTPPAPRRVTADVSSFWLTFATFTRNTKLVVTGVSPGMQVRLTCAGTGCPFKAHGYTVTKAGSLGLTKALAKAKLRTGAVVEVRVTEAESIGKVMRWTIRKRTFPKLAILCLPPGAAKPAACS